jgi:hypothetical protein
MCVILFIDTNKKKYTNTMDITQYQKMGDNSIPQNGR